MDPREIGIEFARHLSTLVRREQQRPETELHRLEEYCKGLEELAEFMELEDGHNEEIAAAGQCMAGAVEHLTGVLEDGDLCQGGTKA